MHEVKSITYTIKGMDCAGCVNTVETFCKRISGVQKAEVLFSSSILNVDFNESTNAKEKLEKGIYGLGFQLSEHILEKSISETKKTCCSHSSQSECNPDNKNLHINAEKNLSDSLSSKKLTNHIQEQDLHKNRWLPIFFFILAYIFLFIIEHYSKNIGFGAFIVLTLIGLYPVAKKSWVLMKVGFLFSVETLMTISAIGAIAIGAAEEAAAVIILFMIGETLEGYTARRARSGIQSLASLLPAQALVIDKQGIKKSIPSVQIQIDDLIEVKPGERIPVDGLIYKGISYMDESLLTGESIPTMKSVGEKVVAGSISTDGNIIIQATRLGIDNTITKMIKMVEEAQSSKSKSMRSIEKFSRIYTPIILLLGTLVAVLPPLLFSYPWIDWIYRGLTILLIGCPCALVISTPSAIASGITAATKLGILIKNASALEIIGKVTRIAFDKTGTITYGKLQVNEVISFHQNEYNLLQIATSVEEKSTHPLAKAVFEYATNKNIKPLEVSYAKALPGIGAVATINQKKAMVCSPHYAMTKKILNPEQENQIRTSQLQGKTIVLVLFDENPLGYISLSDEIKPDAKSSIIKLKKMGINSLILTGDNKVSAHAIASQLDVEIAAELLPEEKLSHIKMISKNEKIAMVGDGINDAPAIAASDIGIAMGTGTDVAVDTAQIIISRNNISAIVDTIELSRKTMNNIKQNITLAIGLKALFLLLTVLGETQLWMAILADTGATVLVTLNAIRLLRYKGSQLT